MNLRDGIRRIGIGPNVEYMLLKRKYLRLCTATLIDVVAGILGQFRSSYLVVMDEMYWYLEATDWDAQSLMGISMLKMN